MQVRDLEDIEAYSCPRVDSARAIIQQRLCVLANRLAAAKHALVGAKVLGEKEERHAVDEIEQQIYGVKVWLYELDCNPEPKNYRTHTLALKYYWRRESGSYRCHHGVIQHKTTRQAIGSVEDEMRELWNERKLPDLHVSDWGQQPTLITVEFEPDFPEFPGDTLFIDFKG